MPLRYFTIACLLSFPALLVASPVSAEENYQGLEKRLYDSVRYLASDELGGRGVGTEGIAKAADYIADSFRKIGLKTELYDGGPFQTFSIDTDAELGKNNRLAVAESEAKDLKPSDEKQLKIDEDFRPLAVGGSGEFTAPVVFVGYGITDEKNGYDEYADIDVKDKAVIIIRKEPQQTNPHSIFDGTKNSRHALFSTKVSNAFQHGAAAVLFVNDFRELATRKNAIEKQIENADNDIAELNTKVEAAGDDEKEQKKLAAQIAKLQARKAKLNQQIKAGFDTLPPFTGGGSPSGRRKLPTFFVKREMVDQLLQDALKTSLADIEKKIDADLEPQSAVLTGLAASGSTDIIQNKAEVKNVIGVLPGAGDLADETIVIGAHYDHLGRGGTGSLAPWTKDIHNGADDNASGAASLVEVARILAASKTPNRRRLVFIAFTGEERGLLGSARYVREPRFSLKNTVAMINMDMVGRLTDNKLIIQGHQTAKEFETLIDDLNKKYAFKLTKKDGGYGPSDHSSFYSQQIPVMHLFTGTHNDYHRPSDDFDKVNVAGMKRITDMVVDIVTAIDQSEERPTFVEVKETRMAAPQGDRPYFGSIPDFAQDQPGYALMGVTKGSPADKAGIKKGDIIIQLGDNKIGNLEDFDAALRKYNGGDRVPVIVLREKKNVTVKVELDPPK